MNGTIATRWMLWPTGFALIFLMASRLLAQPEGVARPGTLRLKNGDFVSGRLDPGEDGQELRWRSSLFQDAIRFDIRGVSRLSYAVASTNEEQPGPTRTQNPLAAGFLNLLKQLPKAVPMTSTHGARIELDDGQVLFGRVESLDDQMLQVVSERHGTVRINRTRVVELDGVSTNASLLFDGTGNLSAWTVLNTSDFGLADWQASGRDLVTTKVGANIFYQPPEGSRFIYEVSLSGHDRPAFQLVFGMSSSLNDVKNGFSLETWDDDLVIHRQASGPLRYTRLPRPEWNKSDWELSFVVYCDPDARKLTVFSQGVLLGELHTEGQVKLAGHGVLVRNRGGELRVTQARVRKWVGPLQNEAPTARADLVVLTDGTWRSGQVRSVDTRQNQLVLEIEGEQQVLPAEQIDRLRFQVPSLPAPSAMAQTEVTYVDGGLLRGTYLRTDEQGVWLTTDFANSPVLAGWQNLLEIQWRTDEPPAEPHAKHGLVEHAGCSLHGRVLNGRGPSDLIWEPIYSRQPVAFLSTRTTRVTFEPRDHRIDSDGLVSELSLTNGDAIPCEVTGIDREAVTARFAAGESVRIPRDHFKALRDFRPENWVYEGFTAGDQWYSNRQAGSDFRFRDNAIELYGDVLLTRQLPLPDRFRVSFDVRFWRNASLLVGVGADTATHALDRPENRALTEEMMKDAAKQRPDSLIEMTITREGHAVTARGNSRVAGILGMMFRANVFGMDEGRNSVVTLGENGALHVEFLVDRPARQYVILGNGRELFRWRDPTPLEGSFLHFGLAPMQDGGSGTPSKPPQQPYVALYNFRVDGWPGLMSNEHRARFLTRRTGARQKSVTHALRAINGDALRGRLEEMTDDQIRFQSRLETLSVPRETVVEIISLQPESVPKSSSSEARDGAAARVRLWGGGSVTLQQLWASEDYLFGTSALAGSVSVPWSAVATIEFGATGKPELPYADWVLRDPPPLPDFEADGTSGQESAWLNKPAPDFTVTMLDGEKVALATLRGRPVILDFWATWCGPCVASMPAMMELSEEFAGKVEFIAMNQQEDPDEVREFLASRLWKLRVGLDTDGSLNRLFGVNAIPYTMILDREGIVRHVHIGATPDLKAELTEVLNGLLEPSDP